MSTTVSITYRPAAERFAAYRTAAEVAKAEFVKTETALLGVLTKAQLMATGDVAIHESYTKPELIEDAVKSRWNRTAQAEEYDRLMHLDSREDEVVQAVEKAQERLRDVLSTVARLAESGDVYSLDGAMQLVRQTRVLVDLWTRVAELTGPDGREPLDAIRTVAKLATQYALDRLEDNSMDLHEARVTAKWIRRNEHLIKALEYYK